MEHEHLERTNGARPRPAPAPAGGRTSGLLALQQSAGNQAVSSMVGAQRLPEGAPPTAPRGVQRIEMEELEITATPPAPAESGGSGAGPAESAGGTGPGAATTPADSAGGGINELGPVARTGTLIADTVVASSYTPGAGNVW